MKELEKIAEIDSIKDWDGIREFLDKNIGEHDEENCSGFPRGYSCDNCKEYFEIVDYFQKIAKENQSLFTPLKTGEFSFEQTIKYMKEKFS